VSADPRSIDNSYHEFALERLDLDHLDDDPNAISLTYVRPFTTHFTRERKLVAFTEDLPKTLDPTFPRWIWLDAAARCG
jgi:hypothetical protein